MNEENKKGGYIEVPSSVIIVFMLLIFILICIFAPQTCHANPTARVSCGEAWGVSMAKGQMSEPAPASLWGLGISTPLAEGYGLITDLVLVVPRDSFHPSFRPVAGVVRKWEKWTLAVTGMYQYSPAYSGPTDSHMVGLTVGPGYAVLPQLVIGFSAGYRLMWKGPATVHIFSAGPGVLLLF